MQQKILYRVNPVPGATIPPEYRLDLFTVDRQENAHHMITLFTRYSDHENNIFKFLQRSKHPRSKWWDLEKKYLLVRIGYSKPAGVPDAERAEQ